MTWNVAGLSASKILHFENFVYSNKYHIISVTEAELPKDIPPPTVEGLHRDQVRQWEEPSVHP